MSAAGRRLSVEEIAYLREHSGLPPEVWAAAEPDTRPLRPAAWGDTLSVDEAVARLDVDAPQLLQMVAHRDMFAWQVEGAWRIPLWQFTGAGLLPRLPELLAALPTDLQPDTVSGFVCTPQDDLDGMTVTEWLTQGGDPSAVAFAASSLYLW